MRLLKVTALVLVGMILGWTPAWAQKNFRATTPYCKESEDAEGKHAWIEKTKQDAAIAKCRIPCGASPSVPPSERTHTFFKLDTEEQRYYFQCQKNGSAMKLLPPPIPPTDAEDEPEETEAPDDPSSGASSFYINTKLTSSSAKLPPSPARAKR